jgi:hypothetical protein
LTATELDYNIGKTATPVLLSIARGQNLGASIKYFDKVLQSSINVLRKNSAADIRLKKLNIQVT